MTYARKGQEFMKFSAFSDDCLSTLDATAISEAIAQGKFRIEDALSASIERAKKSQSHLHAMVVNDFDRVMERAKRSKGHLPNSRLNVPSVLKDNIKLEGLPTRFGSQATPSRPEHSSDLLVNQLHSCGLHFIGKSATPAFGFSCSTEFDDGSPPTRNPWNLDLSAGGSSGGSAALVASGVVPIAHGNDGGGSLRIPAAICGVIGMKPTRGRLMPQPKARFMPVNIIADGIISRSIRDQANFYFDAEKFFANPKLKPIGEVQGPNRKRLKIGFVYDSVFTKACPDTRLVVDQTIRTLAAAGHSVEETQMPTDERFAADFTHYWCALAFGIEKFGPLFFGLGTDGFARHKLDRLTKGLSSNFKKTFWENFGAIQRLRGSHARLRNQFSRFDALVSPVIAKTTPPIGYFDPKLGFEDFIKRLQEYVGYTPLENVLGNPAIALPLGRSNDGKPIGIQISAAFGEERTLLELGFELEAAIGWPTISQAD
jgi:amidase